MKMIKTVTMEDRIKKILEEYKVYGAKQDLITEELLVLFSVRVS